MPATIEEWCFLCAPYCGLCLLLCNGVENMPLQQQRDCVFCVVHDGTTVKSSGVSVNQQAMA
jgi:hypothetical protein